MANEFYARNGLISLNNATVSGSVTSTVGFVKSGGSSSQFLKADGSVDSTSYITLTSISASTPLSYNSSTGGFSISQSTTSTSGYLSASDWNTFNSKQTAYTNLTSIGSLANGAGVLYNNGTGTFSYTTTPTLTGTNFSGIPNGALTNSSITVQGTSVSLGGSVNPINGTGFVKASGTTISYDNNTYLTTSSAASTYQPLENQRLSTTNSPTFAGGTYNGNVTISSSSYPALIITDITNSKTWSLNHRTNLSSFAVTQTGVADMLIINETTGNSTFYGSVTASSFSGSGSGLTGTASSLSIGGNAATATNSTQLNGYSLDNSTVYSSGFDYLFGRTTNTAQYRLITPSGVQSWLGLGSAAYSNVNYFLRASQPNNTNLNNSYIEGSTFWLPSDTSIPASSYGSLLNIDGYGGGSGSGWNNQVGFGTDNKVWFRQSINNNTSWTSWRQFIFADMLGSNAYTSTAYLPLTGGTLTGALTGTSATFSSSVTASSFSGAGTGLTGTASGLTAGYSNGIGSTPYNGSASASSVGGIFVYDNTNAQWRTAQQSAIQSWLGLGSNAYTSTAYLPLSGGTLTGALSGTSASFNTLNIGNTTSLSTLTIGNGNTGTSSWVTLGFLDYPSTAVSRAYMIFNNRGSAATAIGSDANGNLVFGTAGAYSAGTGISNIQFTINQSTGAATFSSSVIATKATFNTGGNNVGVTITGNTTSNVLADINVSRSGTPSSGVGSGSALQLSNTTTNDGIILQVGSSGSLLLFNNNAGAGWVNNYTFGPSGATFNQSVTATGFFESSDILLKNILNSYQTKSFGVVDYTWKDGRDNKQHVGYIAQEVQKFLPSAVMKDHKGFLTVNYHEAHAYKIRELEFRIQVLEEKLKKYES